MVTKQNIAPLYGLVDRAKEIENHMRDQHYINIGTEEDAFEYIGSLPELAFITAYDILVKGYQDTHKYAVQNFVSHRESVSDPFRIRVADLASMVGMTKEDYIKSAGKVELLPSDYHFQVGKYQGQSLRDDFMDQMHDLRYLGTTIRNYSKMIENNPKYTGYCVGNIVQRYQKLKFKNFMARVVTSKAEDMPGYIDWMSTRDFGISKEKAKNTRSFFFDRSEKVIREYRKALIDDIPNSIRRNYPCEAVELFDTLLEKVDKHPVNKTYPKPTIDLSVAETIKLFE